MKHFVQLDKGFLEEQRILTPITVYLSNETNGKTLKYNTPLITGSTEYFDKIQNNRYP